MDVKLNYIKNHCGVYQTINGSFTVKALFLDKHDYGVGFILESNTNLFTAGYLDTGLVPCTNSDVWEKLEVETLTLKLEYGNEN